MNDDKAGKYILNKVFSGSYLLYNLGNELINFMKINSCDKDYERLIYINPYGTHDEKESKNAEFVLHVMNVKYEGVTYYELVAISEIDRTENLNLFSTNAKETRDKIKEKKIEFESCPLEEVFDDSKSYLCSFIAKNFYTPKNNIRILFYVDTKNKKPRTLPQDKETIKFVKIKSNPQHSFCYSLDEDQDILDNIREKYFKLDNDFNIILPDCTEQSLSIICDRTKLEDSTSNQIAYFLSRDKNIMGSFINYLNTIRKKEENEIVTDENTRFEILREHEHIDLLIKVINRTKNNDKVDYMNDHIIVIENKIDSGINGIENNSNSKAKSQLSNYYDYITSGIKKTSKGKNAKEKINEELKNINNNNKHFFILEPSYSTITPETLNKNFECGERYSIIHYNKLIDILPKDYNPYDTTDENVVNERKFLYKEFIKTLEYINMTSSSLMREIAYIRLKQRLDELGNKTSNN